MNVEPLHMSGRIRMRPTHEPESARRVSKPKEFFAFCKTSNSPLGGITSHLIRLAESSHEDRTLSRIIKTAPVVMVTPYHGGTFIFILQTVGGGIPLAGVF